MADINIYMYNISESKWGEHFLPGQNSWTTAQGGGIQTESSSLAELRRPILGFRRSRYLEFVKHSTGRRQLHRERGPEMCIRDPLRPVEYGLHGVKLHKAQ